MDHTVVVEVVFLIVVVDNPLFVVFTGLTAVVEVDCVTVEEGVELVSVVILRASSLEVSNRRVEPFSLSMFGRALKLFRASCSLCLLLNRTLFSAMNSAMENFG